MKNLMRLILNTLRVVGLVLTLLPSILFFLDIVSLDAVKTSMIIGLVCWFAGSLFRKSEDLQKVQ